MKNVICLIILVLALLTINLPAQTYFLARTFQKSTPVASDGLGSSVAALGNNILVGVPGDDTEATDAGVVYLFDSVTGTVLRTFQKPNPAASDFFGSGPIAALGNNVLVGVPGDDTGAINAGAVYLFDGTTGALLHTFLNPTPAINDEFGSSIAAVGNNVLVGAYLDNTGASNAGAAYLFDGITGTLLKTFLSPTPDASDLFGTSVAAVGNNVLIGADGDDTGANDAGAAYLFDSTTGNLLETFLNPTPAADDIFGQSVAALGNNVLVGAPLDDTGAPNAGAVYLFDGSSGVLLRTFLNPTPALGDAFGIPIVAVGNNVLIGANSDDIGATDAGATYLFDGTTGALLNTFQNPTPAVFDIFGGSIAAIGNNAIIGAGNDDTGATDAGAAYLFAAPATPLVADAGPDKDILCGQSVTIGGNPTASGGLGGPYTFSWTPTVGLNDAASANPNVSPTATTTYTVTVTETATGLSDMDEVTVTVLTSCPPNIFTVTNTNDSGLGSLRQAILDANATANVDASTPDRIEFNISGAGPHTISPLSALPIITDPVIIDGLTQPGASNASWPPTLKIELDGSNAGLGAQGLIIHFDAGGSTVRGLVINRFKQSGPFSDDGNGIVLAANGDNVVSSCFIGTDVSGTIDFGNDDSGIEIIASNNNIIGGTTPEDRNLISGNNQRGGIHISSGSSGNLVQGNFIGTDITGTVALGNNNQGILIEGSQNNTIGGTIAGARNLISGNAGNGIRITSHENVVQGNYIGTNVTGTSDLGNDGDGILLEGSEFNTIGGAIAGARNIISGNGRNGIADDEENIGTVMQGNYIGTDVTGTVDLGNDANGIYVREAEGGTLGGTTPGAGNLISGNGENGVYIFSSSQDVQIQNNYIGTDVNGANDLGNGGDGILVERSRRTVIGGTDVNALNLISGNTGNGIQIIDSQENLVQGNYIGANVNGAAGLGNDKDGIRCSDFCANNTIGGTEAGAGNLIAFNQLHGVSIFDDCPDCSINNALLGNSIFSNGNLGIDLEPAGVTANDAGDTDTGPNNLQNFPVLTSATVGVGLTTINGSLNSAANATFRIEFFSNPVCNGDVNGNAQMDQFGEGKTFLGFTEATTDGNGDATFSTVLPVTMPASYFVTATATDAENNTSEFSHCVAVTIPPAPTPTGTNVNVQPVDVATGSAPAQLTFSTVTQSGTTSLATSSTGPMPPTGFNLGDPATYYELTTTALFSGLITVCIDYSGVNFTEESQLKLFHFENGEWVDRTSSLDTGNDIICAQVNSLSPFAIFQSQQAKPFVLLAETDIQINGQVNSDGDIHANNDIFFNQGNKPNSFHTGSVTASDDIFIKKNNKIVGTVKGDDVENSGTVTGGVTENAGIAEVPLPVLASLDHGDDDVIVKQGKTLTLAPGDYAEVKVGKKGTLKLTSGTYNLECLNLREKAMLVIDLTSGLPITINADEEVIFGKNVVMKLMPASASTELITINCDEDDDSDKDFDDDEDDTDRVIIGEGARVFGNIIAPETMVVLDKKSRFKGAICAENLLVLKGARFVHHSSVASFPKESEADEFDEFEDSESDVITDYILEQNFPNPFNPSTDIAFALPEAGKVTLNIYALTGQLVATLVDGELPAGDHLLSWNGRNQTGTAVAAGVYLYRIVVQDRSGATVFTESKRMTMLK